MYDYWARPRLGTKNPENMSNAYYTYAVQTGFSSIRIRQAMDVCELDQSKQGCWSFNRFGSTLDVLQDGTMIGIAGDYDEEYYKYNDVVVVRPNGEIWLYGYPIEVFARNAYHTTQLNQTQGYID